MTTLLRTEYFIVGVNTQAVVLFVLTIQFYTEIVLHITFRHPTERQRNLGIAFILQRKIKEKIIKTVLSAGIITPQGRELHPTDGRKRSALNRPGGKVRTVLVCEQIARKGLPLLAVKQRDAPWSRVCLPQSGFKLCGLQTAAVRDRLALSGFQMNILYIA